MRLHLDLTNHKEEEEEEEEEEDFDDGVFSTTVLPQKQKRATLPRPATRATT